jgi:hypothetical protein
MCRKKESAQSKANREQARQQHEARVFAFGAEKVKDFNRRTDFKRKTQFISSIGESRQQSDIRQRVMDKISAGLKSKEAIARKYASKRFVNEGGRSRTAGRNIYAEVLAQRHAIDRGIQVAAGRGEAIQQEQQRRVRSGMLTKAYAQQGVVPVFGAPSYMPSKQYEQGNPLMGILNLGLGIAAVAAGGGGSDISSLPFLLSSPLGKAQQYIGTMADEVIKVFPEAVFNIGNGYLGVYYDLIDVTFKEVSS